MATYYLIAGVTVGTNKIFAGTLIDDAITDTAPITAAGGLLWPSSDVTVAAAATKAQSAKLRGQNEEFCDRIMRDAVDTVQKASDAADTDAVDLASTAASKGASLVGVQDAGGLYTATDVEAALAEVKPLADAAYAERVQKKTVTVTAAQLAAAFPGVKTGAVGIGTALPANARLLGAEANVTIKFQNAGDTDTTTFDVGTSAGGHADVAAKSEDAKTTGIKHGLRPAGSATGAAGMLLSAEQGTITFTSDVNLDTLTAGSVDVELLYFVLA